MDKAVDTSYRMNVRIPRAQYELMKKHGAVMGLDTDAACLKYFLTMGLQVTAGSLSGVIQGGKSVEFMSKMMGLLEAEATNVKQLDVVEEAEKLG